MRYLAIILLCFTISCKTNNKAAQTSKMETGFKPEYYPGPHAIVYKTKADYSNNVPVLLSDDKSGIVSYPHPMDIKSGNSYPLPTFLHDGYLLDNRGINKNVAFLKITYEQYAKLAHPLSLQEMTDLIIDKDPLIEMCDCGIRSIFIDLTGQLNQLIDTKKLRTTCKTIK